MIHTHDGYLGLSERSLVANFGRLMMVRVTEKKRQTSFY